MKRLQAYKFLIEPNGDQQRAMRSIAGSCRFVPFRADTFGIRRWHASRQHPPTEPSPTLSRRGSPPRVSPRLKHATLDIVADRTNPAGAP